MGEMLRLHTQSISDLVHYIDILIADGAYMDEKSISAIRMRSTVDKLRMLADRIEGQRVRLLIDQPALPFLQAAE